MYRHANGTLNRLPIMCLKVGEGNRTRDRLFTKISGNGPAQFDSRADRVKGRKGLAQELCNATCLRPGRISNHLATLLARDHPDDRATGRSLDRFLTARETGPTAAGVAINVRESEPLPGWYRRG